MAIATVHSVPSGLLNPDYSLTLPKMEKSQILGCFSVNSNREFIHSAENLKYFRKPSTFPLDLNIGYGLAKSKEEEEIQEERVDNILQFIKHHQDELLTKSDAPNARAVGEFDFICFRGLLRLLMCTPYEPRIDWCIQATKFKENIYLNQIETAQKRECRLNETVAQKKYCSYGYKFEQYCMTQDPSEEPNTNSPVDECAEFCCVYSKNIQGIELLIGAEIIGAISSTVCPNIENKEVLNSMNMVELNCTLRPATKSHHDIFYNFKCRNWWCQSFLVGIEDLMVGFRNDNGLVDEIQHIEVKSLPKLCSNFWTPSRCADFLVKFLQMVKNVLKDVNCPHTVYEFYFNPFSRLIDYQIYRGKSSHTILPYWYVTMLQQRSSSGPKETASNNM